MADPQADLALAQADETAAQQLISTATASQQTARQQLAITRKRADRLNARAAAAQAQLESVKNDLVNRRTAALADVNNHTDDYNQAKDNYDTQVPADVGLAIAALLLALIAVFWSWFRRNPAARFLATRELGPAIGFAVGGLIVVLLIGAGIASIPGRAAGVIGDTIMLLGLGLPVALMFARYSLRRELGLGKSLIWRDRAPRWVNLVSAALLLVLLAGGLGGALSADKPTAPVFSAETRQLAAEAAGNPADPPTPALTQAENAYNTAQAPATAATAARDQAQSALYQANRALARANRQLASAQRAITRSSNQITAQAAAAAAAAAATPAYTPPPVSGTTQNFGSGNGYVVTCNDGTLSDSGGIQGACSHHGGVAP